MIIYTVLMDATGSMAGLIAGCKNTIEDMFKRARLVIESLGITNPFEIQLAVYRNYNGPFNIPKTRSGLLDYSNWEILPANLKRFMETVEADWGMGNEAIEIGNITTNYYYYSYSYTNTNTNTNTRPLACQQ